MSAKKPNGTTNESRAPPVVGINFGNSYASIAVLNKDHVPSCIANEDGERQIATALSFYGEEMYIGNQAKPQLVKNAKNTIVGFRNLLGKTFSEVEHVTTSAASIKETNGEITYTVRVLEPPPAAPMLSARPGLSLGPTPRGSHAATPLQSPPPELAEPVYIDKTLTLNEVASIVIGSLVSSAADFLGQKIQGAVITIPSHFSAHARGALRKAAETAGVHVLQLLDDAAAASLAYSSLQHPATADTTSLILDLGASSLDLTLLSIKQGLVHILESSHIPNIGGDAIDDRLVAFFAKEFTKKTKIPLSPTSTEPHDLRALTKLRLAVEHTKRTLSASPGAASCSVESLKDGMDFSGTINRLRFDMEMKHIYSAVNNAVQKLCETAGFDLALLDEVILVGGSALLPGLATQLEGVLHEDTQLRTDIDSSEVLSRGAAVQAGLLSLLGPNDPLLAAFDDDSSALESQVATKAIGISLVGSEEDGGWIDVIAAETPLPARRTVSFHVHLEEEGEKHVGLEICEADKVIKVDKIKLERDPDDDEEEEEPEEEEVKVRILEKRAPLGAMKVPVVGAFKGKKKKGPLQAIVVVTMVIEKDGSVEVTAHQKDSSTVPIVLSIDA